MTPLPPEDEVVLKSESMSERIRKSVEMAQAEQRRAAYVSSLIVNQGRGKDRKLARVGQLDAAKRKRRAARKAGRASAARNR